MGNERGDSNDGGPSDEERDLDALGKGKTGTGKGRGKGKQKSQETKKTLRSKLHKPKKLNSRGKASHPASNFL